VGFQLCVGSMTGGDCCWSADAELFTALSGRSRRLTDLKYVNVLDAAAKDRVDIPWADFDNDSAGIIELLKLLMECCLHSDRGRRPRLRDINTLLWAKKSLVEAPRRPRFDTVTVTFP
jgi:hypothetical protein